MKYYLAKFKNSSELNSLMVHDRWDWHDLVAVRKDELANFTGFKELIIIREISEQEYNRINGIPFESDPDDTTFILESAKDMVY